MNEGRISTPAKKPQISEAITASPVQLYDFPRVSVASSPSKVLPGDVKVSEKEQFLARLTALDEQQARLQERNELEMLSRQVEEKEAYIHDLEKSLSL
jgi:hypothetical protein